MKVTFLELHIGHYVDAVVTCSGNSVQSRPVDAVDLADYQMWRLFDQQGCQPSQFSRKPPDFSHVHAQLFRRDPLSTVCGDIMDANNYRGIALSNVETKISETLILDKKLKIRMILY